MPNLDRYAVALFAILSLATSVLGQVSQVNSTADADDGACTALGTGNGCTLREAINAANAVVTGAPIITFAIPANDPGCDASGVCTIAPTSTLPDITKAGTTIDGYTQAGASRNTNLTGALNTVLKIQLSGQSAPSYALNITTGNTTVRGLIINRFASNAGVSLFGAGATGNFISGNFIGTNFDGTAALANSTGIIGGGGVSGNFIGTDGNGSGDAAERNLISGNTTGIFLADTGTSGNIVAGNLIGTNAAGTAAVANGGGIFIGGGSTNNRIGTNGDGNNDATERNVISGNTTSGILITNSGTSGNIVAGNFIGTDKNGTGSLGNQQVGVLINGTASNNTIGGNAPGAGNIIAFTAAQSGVQIDSGSGNAVLSNSIFGNGNLGIDLTGDGVTPNDTGDADTGANNLQNFPVVTSATTFGLNTEIAGTLNSTASTTFTLQFFSNATCDASGNGEGAQFLGSATVATNAGGNATFKTMLTSSAATGSMITATATDSSGNTSEFSTCQSAAPVVACASLSFAAATNFGVGTLPRSVAVGDFNGDGNLDLATANDSSNNVSVLLGNGTGGFGAANNFPVGTNPRTLVVGDFNHDGKPDLVTANFNASTVSIFLGNGTGSFAAATSFAAGNGPRSVAVGDFNGDGNLDLVTPNVFTNDISILLGNGAGSFGAPTNFPLGNSPRSVAVGDFNGDGKLDVVTTSSSNTVSVLLGNGSGGFGVATSFPVGSDPLSVVVGDFNGDGKLDLATANINSSDVSVLLGDGAGGFGPATNFSVGFNPDSVVVGDFDGDGKLDLATSNEGSDDVSVLLGDGAGSFSAATNLAVGTSPGAVVAGDFNGDGRPDLASANTGSDDVSVLLNSCTPPPMIFTVVNTNDSGAGSLRQAILDANSNAGADIIAFNIPGAGVHTIALASQLPDITDAVLIDGYTQPGASTNTLAVGDNAVLLIELNGGGTGVTGLNLNGATNSTVRGLVINNFSGGGTGEAIRLGGAGAGNNTVAGCFIGTNVAGTAIIANDVGIVVLGTNNNAIGGTAPAARNLISGNLSSAVSLSFSGATGNTVQGNYIGTDKNGTGNLGNQQVGVLINGTASNNAIGGTVAGASNIIAFTAAQSAVRIDSGTGNAVLSNSIFGNGSLGIDLAGDGVTPNDTGDADTGANNLQNFPVVTSAFSGGSTTVVGTLNSAASTTFRVEFFSNATCSASGNGEGRTLIGSTSVTTDGSGNGSFNTTLPAPTTNGEVVTATATDPANNTSEFSTCRTVTSPPPATLGSYSNAAVQLNGNTTVTPNAAPTNAARIDVSSSTNFKGTLEVDPATGVVRVTNAHPAGSYTITVTAFNAFGSATTQTFTLVVPSPAAACVGASFAPAADLGAGSNAFPVAALVGDFNGDGVQDFVTANAGTNDVSVFLGNGVGSFGAATNFAAGSGPQSVAVGDFNGDGNQDLAVANFNTNDVSILLGDGAGNFAAPVNFPTGNGSISVAVGDFNGDGKQDLAVANTNASSVSILLGDGAGGFSAPTTFAVGTNPFVVVVGDFNGDGKVDLATANFNSSNVSVLLGNGTGGFAAAANFATPISPQSVAVGDFNGDGKQDLVTANFDSNDVSILLGDGTGGFAAATNFAADSNPFSVSVGDFNGDGKQDLAVANTGSDDVSILLGDGAGGFAAPMNFGVGSFPQAVAVGDFNGDGRPDLVTANNGSDDVSLLLSDCTPPAVPQTFGVVNTNDSGTGSFRQAILDSNANAGQVDTITFNISPTDPGCDVAGVCTIKPSSHLPDITDPVTIDGYTQTGASANTLATGNNAVLKIELSGQNAPTGANGLTITVDSTSVSGLAINRFAGGSGISVSGASAVGNFIAGNFIGTDASGTAALANRDGVVLANGATNNIIGTNGDGVGDAAERNVISGNTSQGITIQDSGTTDNIIAGNFIGTNAAGSAGLGNDRGLLVNFAASFNRIGTDGNGTGDVAERNVISSNRVGLQIDGTGTSDNIVAGNYIGTNAAGTAALGNTSEGVVILFGPTNNLIGTDANGSGDVAERNIISGNQEGVRMEGAGTSGNIIAGNFVGTNFDGTAALGNSTGIIVLAGAADNRIGGTAAVEGNLVSFNTGSGITVTLGANTVGNSVLENSIFSNGGLGIDLNGDGVVTPNDPGDGDTGPNNLQNFPVLTSLTGSGVVTGTLDSPSSSYRVEFFANTSCDTAGNGEGQTFLGFITTTGGNTTFTFNAALPTGMRVVTATATNNGTGDTSEFSTCLSKVTGNLTTQASASTLVGAPISDTASLSGSFNATGTITFRAFGPNDATCGTTPAFTSTVAVNGDGNYNSGNFTPTAAGTYRFVASYSGDANNIALATACADPNESVTLSKVTPTVTTQASAATNVGGSVTDTATFASGFNPTGTVIFSVFGPNDTTCGSPAVFTSAKTVNGNGSYTSAPFTPTAPGTYRFVISYSGDSNNNSVSGVCNAANESVLVSQAAPTITTQASAATNVGGSITDTATFASGFNPTGTLIFSVFGPNDATCGSTAVFTSVQTVNGNGAYTSAPFTPTAAGTYRFIINYSGDTNNQSASAACNAPNESVVVSKVTPVVTTQASSAGNVGFVFSDTATLSGGFSPTGTITFNAFGPNDATCSTTPAFTSTATVNGNGTYSSGNFIPGSPGTYRFVATYNGDGNNNVVVTACADPNETVTVGKANPTISTQASAGVALGGNISDNATLAGGSAPTGTITFNVFGPNNATCGGAPAFTSTINVNGAATYPSGSFRPLAAGSYRFVAIYNGDANNSTAGTACGDPNETVNVGPSTPTLTTQASGNITVGGVIFDQATLSGGVNPGGTITFQLFGPNNGTCSGGAIFTSTASVTRVSGAGIASSSTFKPTAAGTYNWIATYSGDPNNNAVAGVCGAPSESVTVSAAPTPTPTPTPTPSATPTPTPTPPTTSQNVSTRLKVETGDRRGIGGFIITGNSPKRIMLRGIGPSLAGFGVTGALADPVLELHGPDGSVITSNDNWRDTQEAAITASNLAPTNDLESAILIALSPGNYTTILSGRDQSIGVGLLEIYDNEPSADSKVANLSTRGMVQTGEDVLILGFIFSAEENREVVVRGMGPSLASAGVPQPLANPTLELRNANGVLLEANDNWKDEPNAGELKVLGLAPRDDLESALHVTLPPGAYTAILTGKNGGTGIGLVEVYNVR